MREILFRGKTVNTQRWIYGYYSLNFGDDTPQIREKTDCCCVEVIPETVGQHTGLADKNGKKIFEGDIVKDSSGKVGIVTFGKGTFDSGIYCYYGWHIKDKDGLIDHNELYLYDEYEWYEVVGNIRDNPELLKGGDSK